MDVRDKLYKGRIDLTNSPRFESSIQYIGGYAIQPTWEDDHCAGLFAFDYLRAGRFAR